MTGMIAMCVSDLLLPSVQVFVLMLLVFSGADSQDGHVLQSDGQPPAQRLQTDAVCQPAAALRRSLLRHLPQPAALPLQLPLHGLPSPGQSSHTPIPAQKTRNTINNTLFSYSTFHARDEAH